MTCNHFEDQIIENVITQEMRYHMAGCTNCRRLATDLHRMDKYLRTPAVAPDSDRLWNKIQTTIKQTESIEPQVRLKEVDNVDAFPKQRINFRAAWDRGGKSIAIAAAMFFTFGLGYLVSTGTQGNVVGPLVESPEAAPITDATLTDSGERYPEVVQFLNAMNEPMDTALADNGDLRASFWKDRSLESDQLLLSEGM